MAELKLLICNKDRLFRPVCEGEIKWTTKRQGTPGKLEFTVINDGNISFQEGNSVRLTVDGAGVFYGFVFSKKRSTKKKGAITVTAYDQLRYFKNKDLYQYKNKRADELLAMIANDYHLNLGTVANTRHCIAYRLEDNQTLFDIMQNALDLTLQSTGRLYVLYDDFGKLSLRDIESMQIPTLICDQTAQDFDYTTTIDGETYNQVKLCYENKDTGKREIYIAKDSSHINDWGLLQYFESLQNNENGKAKADALLSLYNRKTRSLTVKKAFSDLRVRGGSSVPVWLNLGDIVTKNYMVVEEVTHSITTDVCTMDLKLRGDGSYV